MSFITKTCTNCNKSVPVTITVGSRCPHCGVVFGSETTKTVSYPSYSGSGSGDISKLALILIFAGIGLTIVLPIILIFALDIERSAWFFFSFVSIIASIASGAAILVINIDKIKWRRFDWSEYSNPAIFFIGICWTIINVLMIITILTGIGKPGGLVGSINQLGIATLVAGGFMSAVAGAILAIPILVYHEFKN
jgi:predicted RNA-binding Zn-ribbon protein involved in translation (DUF1610 family)